MLEIRDLSSGYGAATILAGLSLEIRAGEVMTLLGRNGMGKTTAIRTIMGLLPTRGGEVCFEGQRLTGLPPHKIARAGLGLVPEGRQVFPNLTVEENLVATARGAKGGWTLPRLYTTFPRLGERRKQGANTLSGGEQQMLAIGRALMTNPKLLILDEATEGLAPLIRAEIWACLSALKAEGHAILLIDKNMGELMPLADRHTVLEKGRVVWSGSRDDLRADRDRVEALVGI